MADPLSLPSGTFDNDFDDLEDDFAADLDLDDDFDGLEDDEDDFDSFEEDF